MEILIKYVKNRLAAFEERNGDAGVLSLRGGAFVEVGDVLIISGKQAMNPRIGKQTKIVIVDHGMYYDDAIALIERNS